MLLFNQLIYGVCMPDIQEQKEQKTVGFAQDKERVIDFVLDNIKEIDELTQDEVIQGSNDLVKELGTCLDVIMKNYGKPYPIAFILNAMMNIYVTTILSSMTLESVIPIVEDHFSRIIKDIESMNKAKS